MAVNGEVSCVKNVHESRMRTTEAADQPKRPRSPISAFVVHFLCSL